jgi:hypothetical protein
MRREDFYQIDDIDALRMESDLLALENEFLRSRLDQADGQQAPDSSNKILISKAEYERLRRTQSDLRWLLQRLNGTVVGPLLKLWKGWRRQMERRRRSATKPG